MSISSFNFCDLTQERAKEEVILSLVPLLVKKIKKIL